MRKIALIVCLLLVGCESNSGTLGTAQVTETPTDLIEVTADSDERNAPDLPENVDDIFSDSSADTFDCASDFYCSSLEVSVGSTEQLFGHYNATPGESQVAFMDIALNRPEPSGSPLLFGIDVTLVAAINALGGGAVYHELSYYGLDATEFLHNCWLWSRSDTWQMFGPSNPSTNGIISFVGWQGLADGITVRMRCDVLPGAGDTSAIGFIGHISSGNDVDAAWVDAAGTLTAIDPLGVPRTTLGLYPNMAVIIPALSGTDNDGDGWTVENGDCADTFDFIYPGAPELCNGWDDDCDSIVPANEQDFDGDGWLECEDCDDSDASVYPGAPELCDLLDNDCDGSVAVWEQDNDGDGFANYCGNVSGMNDCDDTDAGINPLVTDVCGDGIDQDCDGADDTCDIIIEMISGDHPIHATVGRENLGTASHIAITLPAGTEIIQTMHFRIIGDTDADFTTVENDIGDFQDHWMSCILHTGTGGFIAGPEPVSPDGWVVFENMDYVHAATDYVVMGCDLAVAPLDGGNEDIYAFEVVNVVMETHYGDDIPQSDITYVNHTIEDGYPAGRIVHAHGEISCELSPATPVGSSVARGTTVHALTVDCVSLYEPVIIDELAVYEMLGEVGGLVTLGYTGMNGLQTNSSTYLQWEVAQFTTLDWRLTYSDSLEVELEIPATTPLGSDFKLSVPTVAIQGVGWYSGQIIEVQAPQPVIVGHEFTVQ